MISSGCIQNHSSFLFCFGSVFSGCGILSPTCRSCLPVSSQAFFFFFKQIIWLIGNASYYSLASWMSKILKVEIRAIWLATAWWEQSDEWAHHRSYVGPVSDLVMKRVAEGMLLWPLDSMWLKMGGVSAILRWAPSQYFFLWLAVQHVWKDTSTCSRLPSISNSRWNEQK